MEKRSTNIFRLKSGRLMEYAEFGDPEGTPVVYFHGFSGSGRQARLTHDTAERFGFRLIAPDRPGVGRSTPHHFRSMLGYSGDIEELADYLGLDTFAVLGVSAGGSFALATAHALPNRVRLASVAGCLGPLNVSEHLQQMQWARRLFLSTAHHHAAFMNSFLSILFRLCRRYPLFFYRWLIWNTSLWNIPSISGGMLRDVLWQDYENVFLQKNGVRAMIDEIHLYFHWGFDLRKFPAQTRVLFWHAKDDVVAPWPVLTYLSRPIRRAETIVCPEGHMTFLTRIADVLARMRSEWSENGDDTHLSDELRERTVGQTRRRLSGRDILYGTLPFLRRS